MKILFLDFDGVLNSHQSAIYQHRNRNKFERKYRDNLYRFCRDYLKWDSNPWEPYYYNSKFCPIACSNIQYLCEEIKDLKIVVSSVWKAHGVEFCKRILKRNGITAEVIGKTPREHKYDKRKSSHYILDNPRAYQIQQWLDNNKNLDIDNYLIVDDDNDMEWFLDTEHFIYIDRHLGFTYNDCQKAIEYLSCERNTNFEKQIKGGVWEE